MLETITIAGTVVALTAGAGGAAHAQDAREAPMRGSGSSGKNCEVSALSAADTDDRHMW